MSKAMRGLCVFDINGANNCTYVMLLQDNSKVKAHYSKNLIVVVVYSQNALFQFELSLGIITAAAAVDN